MKKVWIIAGTALAITFAVACGGSETTTTPQTTDNSTTPPADDNSGGTTTTPPPTDDQKGTGKFTSVELTDPLDQNMIGIGQKVYDVKCSSCHKLTDEKLVGPGWKGVTSRRKPEWIMNFVTNTDEMLNKDAEAMSLLEVCLVRMPNQNLADDEARSVLEFMRNNDAGK